MRILVLHSRYTSGPASGENRVVEDEIRLLREAGHHVATWTPTIPAGLGAAGLAAAGAGAVWSRRAAARVRRLMADDHIDAVHVHNLFPMLSPSVLHAAASEGAGVVVTLHNYRLLCLPATLLRDGRPCEDCVGRVPWPGVVHKCYRGSSSASAALAASLVFNRVLGTFRRVSCYLAVSEFVRSKHVQAGFPPTAIQVKPNFAWPTESRRGPGEYFLYLGRLSGEKGLRALLKAWRRVDERLVIAGDGPDRASLEALGVGNVTFLGLVQPAKAKELVSRARALVLPSVSYEGAPRSIPEAYAAGVPVIASRVGALPEFVEEGASGVLFEPGDPESLAAVAKALMDDRESERLGGGARRLWAERFTAEQALRTLEETYRAAG